MLFCSYPAALLWQRLIRQARRLGLVFLSFGLIVFFWQAPVVPSQADFSELRGVWMTNIGVALMYYTTRLDDVVANLSKHHINTLYPAVWNRGYTLHPSPIAQQAGGIERDPFISIPFLSSQDVLAGLVQQTRGVSFFCWETTLWFFKGSSADQIQQTFQALFAS
jgi:uncharacterized lipoprotein YddW (UPF0748 family)